MVRRRVLRKGTRRRAAFFPSAVIQRFGQVRDKGLLEQDFRLLSAWTCPRLGYPLASTRNARPSIGRRSASEMARVVREPRLSGRRAAMESNPNDSCARKSDANRPRSDRRDPCLRGDDDLAKTDDLAPLVYSELRALAAAFMRAQSPGHTLQPTALVNEAYVRLAKSSPEALRSRPHFLAVAARAMRHVLINHATAKKSAKRGGLATRVSFQSIDGSPDTGTRDFDYLEIMAIHEALGLLEELDPRRASVVEAKVFGGLTNEEVAEVLGVSTTTVESDWRTGRAWLAKELRAHGRECTPGDASGR